MPNGDPLFDDPREWIRREMKNVLRGKSGGRNATGWTRTRRTTGVFPPVNIYDDGEGFRVQAELPGIDESDLEVNAKGMELTIRGERAQDTPDEVDWHRRERQTGTFARTITLPEDINTDKVQANLKHGVLNIYAPRADRAQPKKIEIQS